MKMNKNSFFVLYGTVYKRQGALIAPVSWELRTENRKLRRLLAIYYDTWLFGWRVFV